jgi:TRAP-type C4-dicarboxylate transport system permease small subunit
MNVVRIVAIVLIVAGTLGLVYGGFSYTEEKEVAKLGSLEFSVKDEEKVSVPTWVSIVSIAVGAGLLLFGKRKG